MTNRQRGKGGGGGVLVLSLPTSEKIYVFVHDSVVIAFVKNWSYPTIPPKYRADSKIAHFGS